MKNKNYFEGNNADELYLDMIQSLIETPRYQTAPRGMKIKENIHSIIHLKQPKNCLITFKERKINYAFAVIEKLEYLTGKTDPDRLVYYNKNFGFCRNEYGFFDGSYPERFAYWFRYIYSLLKNDPDSRQAVMTIYGIQDRHKSNDIPCTLSLHFLIRNDQLHLIATMRSQDVLWGFPYDINGFCFLQEALAAVLKRQIGTFTLQVGSLHLYEDKEEQLKCLLDPANQIKIDIKNPTIAHCEFDELYKNLELFWSFEYGLRRHNNIHQATHILPDWLSEYYKVILTHYSKKNGDNI